MKTTLNIDDEIMKTAVRLTGINEKTTLVHKGLEHLFDRLRPDRQTHL